MTIDLSALDLIACRNEYYRLLDRHPELEKMIMQRTLTTGHEN
jgi:hypothetical protein